MKAASPPEPTRARRRILPVVFVPILFWFFMMTFMCQSDCASYQRNLLLYVGHTYRRSLIDVALSSPLPEGSHQIAAQVRLGSLPVVQSSLAKQAGAPLTKLQISLPLRPAGPLEVRLAALDINGCVRGSGIAEVRAEGAELIHVSIRIFPALDSRCKLEYAAKPLAESARSPSVGH